ncbi:error-prone DNA polymerase [Oleomonas cavernae]|uniref:Error-prone DNA polymerase n=2 Tax=Oleomonas cavernae TaxID=2320859 RepID=A0A418WIV0_9PROT|nr:error-prone DNA polymerase [Oleomonas cavernae]
MQKAESAAQAPPPLAFAELAATTSYSFLRGASMAEEMVSQAHALGLAAIGVADRNSVAGVVRAHVMARQAGIRLVPGARLVFTDGTPEILAYPRDRAAWGRLTRLLTLGKRRAPKGECHLTLDDLRDHGEGLNLILLTSVIPAKAGIHRWAARDVAMDPGLRRDDDIEGILATFRGRIWLGASMLYRGDDARRLARLRELAARTGTPLLALGDVLYHAPERRPLADVMTCIREHTTLEAAGRLLHANAERHLKPPREMARLFKAAPQAIAESIRFLEGCNFSLDQLRYEYPDEVREGYETPQEALVAFATAGARWRYPGGVPPDVQNALDHELQLIDQLKYAPYFLTVHDIVRYARSIDILVQGRGSAANSVVCYCLGVTEVDPTKVDLLFERFVSEERKEPPDIDVDFEHERREEVIQYIYERFGRERSGLAATVISYRGRSAIREVGKVFGLSEDMIGRMSGMLWGWSPRPVTPEEARQIGLDPDDPRIVQVLNLAQELIGFPRHLSQHVGGFVITRGRLDELVPIENAAMADRTVVEWDKDDLDALGILKIDVLALGMLSCIRRALHLMVEHYGFPGVDMSKIPSEEPAIYDMLSRADSLGVFQVESRAQMTMLPRLQPRKFYDLVIEVAIVRPGPIQGDMVHPYLRRRQGIEKVDYPSPSPEFGDPDELKKVLDKTCGVPLFQEQAMRIAIVAAKFTPGEADRLRRAMATFRRVGTIHEFKDKLVNGMAARGYDKAFAERCFSQIEGFGDYGFPESHAASFALLVYISAWIKCRYPDVFAAAMLNSQPMGFYAPAQLVRDAQEHGVEFLAVDVNDSCWDNRLESGMPAAASLHPRHQGMAGEVRATHAVRLGFRQVSGFPEDAAKKIEEVRGAGFDSVRDLWLRTKLAPAVLERLALADAFRSMGLDRRDALWAVRGLRRAGDKDDLPLFAAADKAVEPDAFLPAMPPGEQVVEDYRHLHLSLKAHPVSFLREILRQRRTIANERLGTTPDGRLVTVAGLVLVRQRPGTASGVIFMTLEDETAIANIVVWPRTFEKFRPLVLGARLVAVTGKVQSESNVIHVIADKIEDLTGLLDHLSEAGSEVETLARADGVKHGYAYGEVMPKGRNFH